MKRIFTILFLSLVAFSAFGQNAPYRINYQAVVRNPQGDVVVGQAVQFRFDFKENGQPVCTVFSAPTVSTNLGIVNTVIEGGCMPSIPWESGNLTMDIYVSVAGAGFVPLGVPQDVNSVPYAIYATEAHQSDIATVALNVPTAGAGLVLSNGVLSLDPNVDANQSNDVLKTDNFSGDVIGTYNATKIAQLGAQTGYVLKWNGSAWTPAPDAGGDNWGTQTALTQAPVTGNGVATAIGLQADGITAQYIAPDAVGNSELGPNAVTTAEIQNSTIKLEDLASEVTNGLWTAGANNAVYRQNGYVGIGNNAPDVRLHVTSLDTIAVRITTTQVNYDTRALFVRVIPNGTAYDAVAVYGESVTALNYGIGGSFQGGYYGVRGTGYSTDGTSEFGTGGYFVGGYNGVYANGYEGSGVYANGQTGVYAGGSAYGLQAYGDIGVYASGSNWSGYFLGNMYNNGSLGLATTNIGSYRLRIYQNGDFGIGLENSISGSIWHISSDEPSNNLALYRNGAYRGQFDGNTGQYYYTSDARLKTDVTPLSPVMDKLMQLRPVSYRFKSETNPQTPHTGFISQEVRTLFPEFTAVNINPESSEEVIGLDYAGLSVIAIKAIQEQQQTIGMLQQENAQLKAAQQTQQQQIDLLMKEMEAMRAQMAELKKQ